MNNEAIHYLDIQQDSTVKGLWLVACTGSSQECQALGIPYDPNYKPVELYNRMADWLTQQTPEVISQTVIGIGYDWTFEEIQDNFIPDATYTAAEFLFRPKEEKPSLLYVSEHYRKFQEFCEQNGYTEPAMTPEVYKSVMAYMCEERHIERTMPYNSMAYFSTPQLDFQFFSDKFTSNPNTLGNEKETIDALNQGNMTELIYLKNDYLDSACGLLVDYHFLTEWAQKHGEPYPEDWAKNIMGEQVTEIFVATHQPEWKQFLQAHQLPELESTMRTSSYKAIVAHFDTSPITCGTAQELHQLLITDPRAVQFVDAANPLLLQVETWCPIKHFTPEDWKMLNAYVPESLWNNAIFQADVLINAPQSILQIGSRLQPENHILLTAEQYPLLPADMQKFPELAPLALQCVLKDSAFITKMPIDAVTPAMVWAAATQDITTLVRLPERITTQMPFTDEELCYMLKTQTLDAQQTADFIRKLPSCYHTPEVYKTLKQLADKHHITYHPDMEYAKQVKRQRGR